MVPLKSGTLNNGENYLLFLFFNKSQDITVSAFKHFTFKICHIKKVGLWSVPIVGQDEILSSARFLVKLSAWAPSFKTSN